jgi:hypothetical protein
MAAERSSPRLGEHSEEILREIGEDKIIRRTGSVR